MSSKNTVWGILLLSIYLSLSLFTAAGAGETDQFRVLDVSERTYDQGPAIAVIFSDPLDPAVRHDRHIRISDQENLLKSAWVLSEDQRVLYFPHVKPETMYSVVILDSLTSADGRKLTRRFIKSLTTRKVTPGVNFAGDGFLLPGKLAQGLPVAAINVRDVVIDFFRLDDNGLKEFFNWGQVVVRRDYEEIKEIKSKSSLVYSGRFELEAPPNKRVINHIPVMNIEALTRPGVYFAVMRQPGEYDYTYQSTFFLVTDIGLHAHIYKNQAVIVASSLKTGQALAGVELTFVNRRTNEVGYGVTDDQGRFVFPASVKEKGVAYIQAAHQDQVSYLPLTFPALDLSEFDLSGRPQRPREIFVYSPRDLYRPGEEVIFSALYRDYDGQPVSPPPLTAVLFRPDGRKVRSFVWRPATKPKTLPGYFQTEWTIPGDAQTGSYRLELRDDPASKTATRVFRFQVEDFLPERLKLELTSEQKILDSKSPWQVEADGQYLYGAPAAGNYLEGSINVRAQRSLLSGWPGYEFGDIGDRNYRDSWSLPDAWLDDLGQAAYKVKNKWGQAKSPLSVRLTASLYETGGRPVNRSLERFFWPAPALVGLRPLFEGKYVDEGTVAFEVIKVTPEGRLQAAPGLLITLIKEDRDYYWEYSSARGWQYKYTEKNYIYLSDVLSLSENAPARYEMNLRRGRYLLTVKDPATNLISSHRFQVGYWWRAAGSRSARPDKVQLELDRPAYLPGDTIRLTVTPPHSGDALIMVEGNELLWFKRISVPAEGTVVEIPVLAHWNSHNIYISCLVLRPGQAREKITPNRAVGIVHLPLDRSQSRLDLSLQAPDRVTTRGPTPLTVKLKLDAPPERDVFVTLAAVDVGILNITGFKTPDPFGWFFAPRRFEADFYDLYHRVIELADGPLARLKYGGDAAPTPGGRRPETKVKLLSLFKGPVRIGHDGQAEASFTLPPDFNGRLRLMAVGFSGDSFGSVDREVTVAAPVVTQMAMPRFLSPGDRSEFTLDVHNMSGQDQDLSVNLTGGHPLTVSDGRQELSLPDGKKTTLSFPVTVQKGFGSGRIDLEVTGRDVLVGGDWQLGVRPGYPAVSRKVRQVLKKGDTFTLDPALAADLMAQGLFAELKISSVLPLNYKQAMKDLITYPYGCLEQTTSRAYPLLFATPDNIDRFGLPFINTRERYRRLNQAIERISLMQMAKGGFGLWSQAGQEESWLTAYAADFLLKARDLGLKIPPQMLEKALKRLDYYLQRKWSKASDGESYDELDFAVRAYAGYVLAQVQRAPLGSLRTLYDNHRQDAGSCLPLAHLGLALKAMGDKIRGNEALKLAAQTRRDGYAYWGDYGSPVRDLAQTLALLLEHDTEPAGIDQVMLDLENELRRRRWFSTQEKFALFKTGLALAEQEGRPWQGRLTAAGQVKALDRKKDFHLSPGASDIAAGISFTSDTEGLLYVAAVVGGYTEDPPEKDDSTIVIERNWYTLKGEKVDQPLVHVGDLLLVHLTLNSKIALPDALVVDLLPAGFEIENPNFTNSVKIDNTDLEHIKINGRPVWKLKQRTTVLHQEYRDDRFVAAVKLRRNRDRHLFYLVRVVSPGLFNVPPPYIESMYRPEIRGIGPTSAPVSVLNLSR